MFQRAYTGAYALEPNCARTSLQAVRILLLFLTNSTDSKGFKIRKILMLMLNGMLEGFFFVCPLFFQMEMGEN